MVREFAKPLMSSDAMCLFRQPGSLKARLVRAGQWRGGSVGFSSGGGPLTYHRLMHTCPDLGPLAGVSDAYLSEVSEGASLEIAAIFVQQLAEDKQVVINAVSLRQNQPTVIGESGQSVVEVCASSTPYGRWIVWVNEQDVVSTDGGWSCVDPLKELAGRLWVLAQESTSYSSGLR